MLLVPAVAFSDFILAIHILAVVIGFGATFSYPIIFTAARHADPKVMPYLWGVLKRIDRYVVNPGLLVVVLAGIYLASNGHYWSDFFVQWGLGAAIVIGGVVGSYMIPRERKLEALATREVAAAGAAGGTVATVTWSPEYEQLQKQVGTVGVLLDLLVVVTVFLMATHAGA